MTCNRYGRRGCCYPSGTENSLFLTHAIPLAKPSRPRTGLQLTMVYPWFQDGLLRFSPEAVYPGKLFLIMQLKAIGPAKTMKNRMKWRFWRTIGDRTAAGVPVDYFNQQTP